MMKILLPLLLAVSAQAGPIAGTLNIYDKLCSRVGWLILRPLDAHYELQKDASSQFSLRGHRMVSVPGTFINAIDNEAYINGLGSLVHAMKTDTISLPTEPQIRTILISRSDKFVRVSPSPRRNGVKIIIPSDAQAHQLVPAIAIALLRYNIGRRASEFFNQTRLSIERTDIDGETFIAFLRGLDEALGKIEPTTTYTFPDSLVIRAVPEGRDTGIHHNGITRIDLSGQTTDPEFGLALNVPVNTPADMFLSRLFRLLPEAEVTARMKAGYGYNGARWGFQNVMANGGVDGDTYANTVQRMLASLRLAEETNSLEAYAFSRLGQIYITAGEEVTVKQNNAATLYDIYIPAALLRERDPITVIYLALSPSNG